VKLSIFGTGYVGLVTGTCFAEMGNDVLCVDVDADKVARLQAGEVPIFEPGLEAMVQSNTALEQLAFTTDIAAGVEHGEVIFIAVGTPSGEDGSADLQYVLSVARSIGEHMTSEKVVVDKSTVPVGTADQVRQTIADTLQARGADIPFHVVSNPEFLKEGAAIADFMKPDRIVIGASTEHSVRVMDQLYAPFNRNHDKMVHMDVRSAELTKYAANVMLATKISLMNELANISDRLGADIEAVRRGIGMDPRIGYHFIYAGTGYGGSCFPKDVKALIHTAEQVGYDAKIVSGVEQVNAAQKRVLFDKLSRHFNQALEGRTFAMWGLAFKPNTDDMREAPSLEIVPALQKAGAKIKAYDPAGLVEAEKLLSDVKFETGPYLCLENADCAVIVTEWNEFRALDIDRLKGLMKTPVLVDLRNIYDPSEIRAEGVSYFSIGRR